jgi:hypothetical protein
MEMTRDNLLAVIPKRERSVAQLFVGRWETYWHVDKDVETW